MYVAPPHTLCFAYRRSAHAKTATQDEIVFIKSETRGGGGGGWIRVTWWHAHSQIRTGTNLSVFALDAWFCSRFLALMILYLLFKDGSARVIGDKRNRARALTLVQRHKRLSAIVWSGKHFTSYAAGVKFDEDPRALCFIASANKLNRLFNYNWTAYKSISSNILCWAFEKIQEYLI